MAAPPIQKGIPIPPVLAQLAKDPDRNKGGHKPLYPFRLMEVGDYFEERIIDTKHRQKILVALRNARKSKPGWVFVWQVGKSVDPVKQRTNLPYIQVWRAEDEK